MSILGSNRVKALILVALVAAISSCGLPRSGPNKREIFQGSVLEQGDAFIVTVNGRVNRATAVTPALGFSKEFTRAGRVGSDTIHAGDVLGISIWENVEKGLLTTAGVAAVLGEIQVDGSGFIFIPYAGRIKASGNTPEALRRVITSKLDEQTPDPQVSITRIAGDGATVSIVGSVSGQGVYPIERPTRTLSAMLAKAGGISIEPEIAKVTVIRGSKRGHIWFQDLYKHTKLDISLRGGDRILVEKDTRAYTALGATGSQNRVVFESQNLSAIEAIAQVGGLSSTSADPTGVFIFRNEAETIAKTVLGRKDLIGTQRMVYVLDLTAPTGMFEARDFLVRDGDTVYVTEAPITQWNKTVAAITGTLSAGKAVSAAVSGL